MTILLLLLPLAAPPETRPEALERKGRESGDHPYFAFAREALAGRRGEEVPIVEREPGGDGPARVDPFGLLSGAAAIDESLALKRAARASSAGPRDVPLRDVPGVTIGEHPWELMMAGRWRYREPLAGLVPHDHWYFTFREPAKLGEMSDLLDAWGGSALRIVQVQDRDYRLRQRYEAQLGVNVETARKVSPALVRAVALTGSDLYWVDGTDVTVIIDTPDPAELIKALGSPKHEIIAGRVVLSNSPAALRRVRETADGRRPSLAASLDFRYMRTVFTRFAKEEDAFVFLSDAFIRALVSPATRIKAMRRAEARAALTLASYDALFRAAEGFDARFDAAALALPDGGPVSWDARRGEAVSEAYGTLRAGTPVLERPIERVTAAERDAYERFRLDYDRLWRRFFDPVGVRFRLTPGEVRAEAYILPLVRTEAYDSLRWAARGVTSVDPARLTDRAAFQLRLTPVDKWHPTEGRIPACVAVQCDDGPGFAGWLAGAGGASPPLVLAIEDGVVLSHLVPSGGPWSVSIPSLNDLAWLVFHWPGHRDFEGVRIGTLPLTPAAYATARGRLQAQWGETVARLLPAKPPPAVYTATFAGVHHFAFEEGPLERRIAAWRRGAKPDGTPAAAGLMLSRQSPHLAATLDRLLEERLREKSHAAATLWQLLYDAKVVTPAMTDAQRDDAALRLLGFVPAVPDGSRFVYDRRSRRVVNARHGTWAMTATHDAPDPSSPLGRLVRSLQHVSADLRFREDGVHTTVTFTRK